MPSINASTQGAAAPMSFNREGLRSQLAELQNNIDALHSAAVNSNIALGGKITSTPQAEGKAIISEPRTGIQSSIMDMLYSTYATLELVNENLFLLNN